MRNKEQTYLGFDFGMKSIGVASGQSITQTATPLTALKAKNGKPLWPDVDALIVTWKPDALIVGIPVNMDGSNSEMTRKARAFANYCQQHTGLPVFECDERLTTQEAKQIIFETEGAKALTKTSIDCFSAKLILESWMKSHILDHD